MFTSWTHRSEPFCVTVGTAIYEYRGNPNPEHTYIFGRVARVDGGQVVTTWGGVRLVERLEPAGVLYWLVLHDLPDWYCYFPEQDDAFGIDSLLQSMAEAYGWKKMNNRFTRFISAATNGSCLDITLEDGTVIRVTVLALTVTLVARREITILVDLGGDQTAELVTGDRLRGNESWRLVNRASVSASPVVVKRVQFGKS